MSDIAETMFSAPEMLVVFSGRALVQRMLDFEAALAHAEARAGLIPAAAADAIASKCSADLLEQAALYRDTAMSGTPAIPLVRMLTALVDRDARRFVHWGATSQDVIDTATILQIRDGLAVLDGQLRDIATACAGLAEQHRHTLMAGRTLLQHAVPITFGLKAARWLALMVRLLRRLRAVRDQVLVVQFGGAAGTLSALGTHGLDVMTLLAEELGLAVPDLPWHAERDRIAEVAGALGVTAGAMAKIATDLALLAQTEVAEVSTGGGGPSSAMPHKHNPTEATAAIASAQLAIAAVPALLSATAQEHERAAGGWQAEWRAVPELFRLTSGAVAWVRRAVSTLEVYSDRMRANLTLTHGLIMAESLTMALAPHLGRPEAFRLVQAACDRAVRDRTDLRQVAAADTQIRATLSPEQIAHALDVTAYLGSTDAFIARALAEFRTLREDAPTKGSR